MPRVCRGGSGCRKQPCFGIEMGRPTHCKPCSEASPTPMINVNKPRCAERGCTKAARWGSPGGRPVRCPKDKLPGMVDVVNIYARLCEEPGCIKQPSFGLELGSPPTHCVECKKDGMFNVIYKRCMHPKGCDRRALYGIESGCPTRCSDHIDLLLDMWDVCSKLCNHESGCKNYPVYGLEKGRPTRCREHNDDDMPNVKHQRCEDEDGCTTHAFFGLPGSGPRFCFKHASMREGMVNLSSKPCIACASGVSYNLAYLGRCFTCYIKEFPNLSVVRNFKTKEAATMEFLREHFSSLGMREDKRVPGGSSKYRPDLILNLSDRVLISEVDENQHWCYEEAHEDHRTMALKLDVLGGGLHNKPLVIVRFNPDAYSPGDGRKRVPSCWKQDPTTRLLGVRDAAAWQERLEVLRSVIVAHISAPLESLKDVHEVRLFYDGYAR